MNKTEFLTTLRNKLAEELPSSAVNSNIQYYDSYISGAVNAGKTEEEVLDELGDPLLIAHTIIDAQEVGTTRYDDADYQDATQHDQTKQTTQTNQTTQERGGDDHAGSNGSMMFQAKYGCLIAAILMIVLVVVVVSLVGSVISFLWPVLVPVLIIVLILSLFKTKGR